MERRAKGNAMAQSLMDRFFAWRYPYRSSDEIREEVLRKHDLLGREVAQRFSRGNVNLKAGRFVDRPNSRLKLRKAAR